MKKKHQSNLLITILFTVVVSLSLYFLYDIYSFQTYGTITYYDYLLSIDSKECQLSDFKLFKDQSNYYCGDGKISFTAVEGIQDGEQCTLSFILKSDAPDGQFLPHSDGSITPNDWFALDGTFYVENGMPYMVFCHEHVQILNGTVEAVRLTDDLKQPASDPFTLFRGSDAYEVPFIAGERYVTDGPFLHRHENGALSLIWSTGVQGKYAQCRAL